MNAPIIQQPVVRCEICHGRTEPRPETFATFDSMRKRLKSRLVPVGHHEFRGSHDATSHCGRHTAQRPDQQHHVLWY